MLVNEIALIVGLWGIAPSTGRAMYLAFFPVAFRAFWMVLKGEKIKFPTTPKDRQHGTFLKLVRPQLALMILSVMALIYAVIRQFTGGLHNVMGLVTNALWLGIGLMALGAIVRAAVWQPDTSVESCASYIDPRPRP
jgi:cellulose synthase (UDP-forming)